MGNIWIGKTTIPSEKAVVQILSEQFKVSPYKYITMLNATGFHDIRVFSKDGPRCPLCGRPREAGIEVKLEKDKLTENQKKIHCIFRDYFGFGPTENQVCRVSKRINNIWKEQTPTAHTNAIQPVQAPANPTQTIANLIANLTRPFSAKSPGGE